MKEHPIYKNWYATVNGEVFHCSRLIKGTITTTGYNQLCINRKSILTHRFIFECINNITLKTNQVINHLDNNKLNNSIANLELTDQKGNNGWFWADSNNYTIKHPEMIIKSLRHNSMAKLTPEQAKEIILLTLDGKTNKEIAEIYGLHDRYISLIRHKKRWKKIWIELGLEGSETIPSGSRHKAMSKWRQP